jgi:hypothetical protein
MSIESSTVLKNLILDYSPNISPYQILILNSEYCNPGKRMNTRELG